MSINKDKYSEWESKIISKFYTSQLKLKGNQHTLHYASKTQSKLTKKNTNDMLDLPTDKHPKQLYKNKIAIVIDFVSNDNNELSKLIQKGNINISINSSSKILPEKHSIPLFHIGNNKLDDVSFGWKKIDNGIIEFAHPSFDLAGLTNYKQLEKTKAPLLPKKFTFNKNLSKVDMTELLSNIHKQWLAYSNKRAFYKYSSNKIQKILQSIINYLHTNPNYKEVKLCFIKFPIEYRVITTSNDIFSSTGKYYKRTYGKGDDQFAEEIKPNKNLYCGITDKYVTPNLNKFNILNEYTA
jgi:hypothetical protein